MSREIRVLFARRKLSSFIRRDLRLLTKHFAVKRAYLSLKKPVRTMFNLIKGVLWSDLTFSWFASTSSFVAVVLSKFLRKKSIVVVGGYDAAYVPKINYGVFTSLRRGLVAKLVYRHADRILVVDESLKRDILRNTGLNIENKIKILPTGYNYDKWNPAGEKNGKLVITVGSVSWSNLKRKGFETFVEAAKSFSDVKFVMIGKHSDTSIDYLKSIAPSNVDFPGFLSENTLMQHYQKAKVYCQLSRYEGLPNALCEAMLCGCVPVGTKICGIPKAIGEIGFYVPYGDVDATTEGIRKALSSNVKREKAARRRIKKIFPSEMREKGLVHHISELLNNET